MKLKLVKKINAQVLYEIEDLECDYPGPITNELLFKDFSKYLRDDDQTDPTNFAIRTKT